jgi:formyl-CoA transferase
VQTSLLAAMVTMMDFQAARYLVDGVVPGQAGNDHPTSMPTSVYPTADGYINIAASGQTIYARLCHALDVPVLIDHADFVSPAARSRNRVALNAALAARTAQWSSAALIARLNDVGVPCGPIYRMDEVFADTQVQHLGLAATVPCADGDDLTLVAPAFTLSRTPSSMRNAMGAAGAESDAILHELGYDAAAIAALRDDGVI